MTNIDLLDRVLAPEGWYAVLGIKGKSVIQKLVQTREEVIETSEKFVAEKRDVYFGCSKFETNKDRTKDNVKVKAIYADQFADVPGVRTADQITMLEEEKIMAYYGAGLLYADPFRQEPLA